MRKIKFRVWDLAEKRMVDDDFMKSSVLNLNELLSSVDQILMQYTGLKDKNSTDIYEGDIITHKVNYMMGIVVWGTYGFVIENLDNTEIIADLSEYDYDPVVIGNIYEDPELLN